jgi:hypothetical protein
VFQVMDDGGVIDLTGATVRLAVQKPSGLTVFQDCEITAPIEGLCEVVLTNQAYIEVGNHAGELVITKDDTVTVTRSFAFSSLNAILNDGTLESQNEWQAIQEVLAKTDLRPILGEGTPNSVVTPEYQGQTYLDTLAMVMYFASTLAFDGWIAIGTGGGGGGTVGSVYWNDVLLKPATFPPSAHTHTWADVTDKPEQFAPTAHTHDWGTGISNKPTAFPPEPHTHDEYLTPEEGNGLYQALGVTPAHTHPWAEVTGKPTTYPPNIMSGAAVGGARVGNGLKMVGEYLTIRDGLGIKTNASTYNLDVDKPTMDTWYVRTTQNLALWRGTQAEYDLITTKDANTLYFIT